MIRFPTCYALFYFALIKKFPYWWIFFHIKRILSHVTPGVPPRKTDGFSWYTVHATHPERVKTWSEAKATYFSVVWTVRKIILVDFVSRMIVIIQSFKSFCVCQLRLLKYPPTQIIPYETNQVTLLLT